MKKVQMHQKLKNQKKVKRSTIQEVEDRNQEK